MKKVLLFGLFLLILLNSICLATGDYSNVKGDYLIFCFGDSKAVVKEKLEYINNEYKASHKGFQDVKLIDYYLIDFVYEKNKLVKIMNDYRTMHTKEEYSTKLKPFVEGLLLNRYTELYGQPTNVGSYPDVETLEMKKPVYCITWDLENKTVGIGVKRMAFPFTDGVYIASCAISKK